MHRDLLGRHRRDDPIVGTMFRTPEPTITRYDARRVSGVRESLSRRAGQHGVDVHGGDVLRTHPRRQQGRVVPGTGADLKDVHAALDVQDVQHPQHEAGSRAGAGGPLETGLVRVLHPLCHQCVIAVDQLRPPGITGLHERAGVVVVELGHEHVPGNGRDGLPPSRLGDDALLAEPVGQRRRASLPVEIHAGAFMRVSAMASAIGAPVSSWSQAHCEPGPHSRNHHAPSPVTAKSKRRAPDRAPSGRRDMRGPHRTECRGCRT